AKQSGACGGARSDLVQPLAGQRRGTGQRPEVDLQEGSGDLDEALEQTGGHAVTWRGGPQRLPGLMRLPEEERVEAVDAVEPLGQLRPRGRVPRRPSHQTAVRTERMAARIAQWMGREPGYVTVRRQRSGGAVAQSRLVRTTDLGERNHCGGAGGDRRASRQYLVDRPRADKGTSDMSDGAT